MKLLLLTATVLAVLSSSSCTIRTKEIRSGLEEAERLVNFAPDSSLSILQRLNSSGVLNKRLRAESALLHSIALDKMGVDMANDSIIAPALDYFSKRGSEELKSKTFYYTARIFENSADNETAMEWLIKAETRIDDKADKRFAALIYSSKGRIYNKLLEYREGASNYSKAADLYISNNDIDRYAACKLREATCYYAIREFEEALITLHQVEQIKDSISTRTLAKYYPLALNVYSERGSKDLNLILNEYLERIHEQHLIDWLTISGIYLNKGDTEMASRALDTHTHYRTRNASYYYRLAQTLESQKKPKEALDAFKEYIRLSGIIGKGIITQDTKFVEERQRHIIQHEKDKEKSIILVLSVTASLMALLAALFIIIAIRKQLTINKNEQFILQAQLDGLLQEREELARTYTENEEGRKIISERLRIIDNFVFGNALQDDLFEKKASETLKKIISDRERFIKQNRLIFNQSHPKFIDFLKTRGLTDIEIEHCCLYATGLNGKMVTNFTNVKRHYHIGSSIRKKLGLNEHDTNISIHIKRLLKKYE